MGSSGTTRLSAEGTLDISFNVGPGPDQYVTSVLFFPGGKLLIGGAFANVDGHRRGGPPIVSADRESGKQIAGQSAGREQHPKSAIPFHNRVWLRVPPVAQRFASGLPDVVDVICAGAPATRTSVPSTSVSLGLVTMRVPSFKPETISNALPRSRPI